MHPIKLLHTRYLQFGCALALLAWMPVGHAALGGNVSSLVTEQDAFGAAFAVARASAYSVHSLTSPAGVRIRQYADASGFVFAVAWDGPVLPNLELLLGTTFSAYAQGQRQRSRGVRIQTPALFLESAGMMRAFFGKGVLTERLPANVSVQDIQ